MPLKRQMNFFKQLFKRNFTNSQKKQRIQKAIDERKKKAKYFEDHERAHASSDPSWSREAREEKLTHEKRVKELEKLKKKVPVSNKGKTKTPAINFSPSNTKRKFKSIIKKGSFSSPVSEAEVLLRSIGIRDPRANEYSGRESRIARDKNNKLSGKVYSIQMSYYKFLLEQMRINYPNHSVTKVLEKEITNLINALA